MRLKFNNRKEKQQLINAFEQLVKQVHSIEQMIQKHLK